MKIKNENGFTLVELMVVIVIIIVVIGLGIAMYFANLTHLRLTSATRDFVNNLRLAQMTAAKENTPVRVTLRSATTYEVVRIEGAQDPIGALVDDVAIKTVDLAAQYKNLIRFDGAIANNTLIFGRLSSVEGGATTFDTAIEAPIDYCNGEFRVNIERSDDSETMRVCINNAGRIRIP